MVLKPSEVKKYYDWFGRKQDSQSFYEDKATGDLIAHSDFGASGKVFEFGCGTGRLAFRLLDEFLPTSAVYLGCDLSPTMIGLATRRLAVHAGRARVARSEGGVQFPLPDHSVDRVVSC